MNETLQTLLNHRSIRAFTNEKVTDEQISSIIEAAQMASTSSYMQAYTIMGVTDEEKKAELARITGQDYVQNNAHLFIFCADLYRHQQKATQEQKENMLANLENTEHLLVSSIDAALAAQNAAIAAESMGLGMCFIGSIRNNIQQVDSLLSLPDHVIPLFGMVIGYPEKQPEQKPRLSKAGIYFENEYKKDQTTELEMFDNTIREYYKHRSQNNRIDSWTEQMLRRFQKPMRMDVSEFVQSKGFNKR
ncbi:oxygen-insensitive NADPH nitroreductase [Pontibacillus yanchengensis]|uniref:Oxygen-insensitive NADPH nitroreductase n=2 Tax=Pontibacillus yanchengensis TaxID=462910 RepID=A0ACC7VDR0_9BACI|nr:oxygen-insensitive NADPH nitroreductase [Pontibacillus yanchengensis]MYL34725.1 oxygen-insensitive NADPH nitroreductase [Pontibacillus yanchengensis]MYL52289.1 oxygen-insensitive NADPH nitroreductase [Pontibacillus yanchengensis]